MMHRHFLLRTGSALLLLLLPAAVTAQYYLSPEDVLLRDQAYISGPQGPREAQKAATVQDEQRLQVNRPAFVEWWNKSSAPATAVPEAVATPPAATTEPPSTPSATTSMDPILQRLLERLARQNIQQGPALAPDASSSTALYSGAPLTGSGPAATATIIVLLGAAGWTVYRARGSRYMTGKQR